MCVRGSESVWKCVWICRGERKVWISRNHNGTVRRTAHWPHCVWRGRLTAPVQLHVFTIVRTLGLGVSLV